MARFVTRVTRLCDLHHRLPRGIPLPSVTLESRAHAKALRRAAKFAVVALLIASLGAPPAAASCCQRHIKKTAASNHCSHHAPSVQSCRAWQASPRADCSCISDAAEPASSSVVSSEYSSEISAANGNMTAEVTMAITLPPRWSDKPPPLRSVCRQAVSCTFLI